MHRTPLQPSSSDATVMKLTRQVADLQKKLTAIEKCLSVDASGNAVTLKGTTVTIESSSTMELKAAATMNLKGAMINLN